MATRAKFPFLQSFPPESNPNSRSPPSLHPAIMRPYLCLYLYLFYPCLYWSYSAAKTVSPQNTNTIDLNPEDFLFLISGTYGSGSADGACSADDLDCIAHHDHLGMEAIRSLHQQLDDDDNGDIDLSESDDVSLLMLKF